MFHREHVLCILTSLILKLLKSWGWVSSPILQSAHFKGKHDELLSEAAPDYEDWVSSSALSLFIISVVYLHGLIFSTCPFWWRGCQLPQGRTTGEELTRPMSWILNWCEVPLCTVQMVHSNVVNITEMAFIGSKITSVTRVLVLLTDWRSYWGLSSPSVDGRTRWRLIAKVQISSTV